MFSKTTALHQLLVVFFLFNFSLIVAAQNSKCNYLGVWLWRLEYTNVKTHKDLADSLNRLGINRIYIKTVDGRAFDKWTQHSDTTLVNTYRKKGIEVWSWSYNYPNNEALQAQIIEKVAKTGYAGHIVDVEVEFDDDSLALYKLFNEFGKARQKAINDAIINKSFELRCTTWGNPSFHDFNLKAIDPFIQAYMPQTYVEQWGKSYTNNLEKWIDNGNKEYQKLGATKPIYHIVASENNPNDTTKNIITAAHLNRFIEKAGSQTSVWAVPQKAANRIWNTWRGVNWKKDFVCPPIVAEQQIAFLANALIYPNPFNEQLAIEINENSNYSFEARIVDLHGRLLQSKTIEANTLTYWDTSGLSSGIYFLHLSNQALHRTWKVIKL
jgi:hypothetical protein